MPNYPEWYFQQSGVIPFRQTNGQCEVLLITTTSGRNWTIPKGIVEPDLSPPLSAAKEAFEEAGIEGSIGDAVGIYERSKWGGRIRVEVFPMRVNAVADKWPEDDIRRREWLAPEEAARRVRETDLAALLRRAGAFQIENERGQP